MVPGRTTTEQSYKFPVRANVGVLFSLDIRSRAFEKHIEPLFLFSNFCITQPCHVLVHGAF